LAKSTKQNTPKSKGEKKADQISSALETIKVDDTPKIRSKNLNVLEEFAKSRGKTAVNFVVIGQKSNPGFAKVNMLTISRPCRRGKEYADGQAPL
jgi:hypothetical protein